tara:strand:+ start:116 stop:430 length:315 start_codon:yes stop_codon:yes gene_type:complete
MDKIIKGLQDIVIKNTDDIKNDYINSIKKLCIDNDLYYPDIMLKYFNIKINDYEDHLIKTDVTKLEIDGHIYYQDNDDNIYISKNNDLIGELYGKVEDDEIVPY